MARTKQLASMKYVCGISTDIGEVYKRSRPNINEALVCWFKSAPLSFKPSAMGLSFQAISSKLWYSDQKIQSEPSWLAPAATRESQPHYNWTHSLVRLAYCKYTSVNACCNTYWQPRNNGEWLSPATKLHLRRDPYTGLPSHGGSEVIVETSIIHIWPVNVVHCVPDNLLARDYRISLLFSERLCLGVARTIAFWED